LNEEIQLDDEKNEFAKVERRKLKRINGDWH